MDRKPKRVGRNNNWALPLLGDYPSRKEWESACWERVLNSKELLQLLATPHERRDLVMRAAALWGLVSGKSYRQISKEFFVSLQTINGIRKAMAGNGYKSYLERSKKERKKKKYSVSRTPIKKHRGRPQRTKYGTIYMPY